MKKELEVAIKRSGKLTVTEIVALTEKIIEDANSMVTVLNASFKNYPSYKKELKALKTKTGVLSAERSILFLAQKHKKVSFSVFSEEYTKGLNELNKKYQKGYIPNWKGSSEYKKIKNELILSQVKAESMDKIVSEIHARLLDL